MKSRIQTFWRIIISIGISLIVISLIFRFFTYEGESVTRSKLIFVLRNISFSLIGLYLICALIQAFFRAVRYNILLTASGEKEVPGFFHLYLVTLTRNMFVDFLPARAGELSYIAMLNKGCEVSGEACVSSLTISLLFDFVALFLLVSGMLFFQLLYSNPEGWLIIVFIGLACLIIIIGLTLFSGIKRIAILLEYTLGNFKYKKFINRLLNFINSVGCSIDKTRQSDILVKTLFLSLGVRIFKYTGFYFLFLAITISNFENLSDAPLWKVLLALLSAEGTASLPIPSFMSFGTYETGGLFALKVLGFSAAGSAVTMLAIHIYSQIIDYSIGSIGVILFLFYAPEKKREERVRIPDKKYIIISVSSLIFIIGLLLFLLQYRNIRKLGSINPPSKGRGININKIERERILDITKNLKGFIVWSSNRSGNHDIFMLSMPDLLITRLTDHSNVDYFPRISPDGKKIVFSRSQLPWVSQRDYIPWDVYMLDIESRRETLIAKNGNTPTWSEDGKMIYFQRNAKEFIKYNLDTQKEHLIFKSGVPPIPNDVILETPNFNMQKRKLAVTIRGSKRMTAIYSEDGEFIKIDAGCQISWAPDYTYLYYVDHIGKQGNAFFKYYPQTKKRIKWFALDNIFRHRYFPKVSNNGHYLVFGASIGGHEHDSADYEIFLWEIGSLPEEAVRVTFHTGNDCWPDIYVVMDKSRLLKKVKRYP
jgi:hypothetical protein